MGLIILNHFRNSFSHKLMMFIKKILIHFIKLDFSFISLLIYFLVIVMKCSLHILIIFMYRKFIHYSNFNISSGFSFTI
jgi:hypothetical protein